VIGIQLLNFYLIICYCCHNRKIETTPYAWGALTQSYRNGTSDWSCHPLTPQLREKIICLYFRFV